MKRIVVTASAAALALAMAACGGATKDKTLKFTERDSGFTFIDNPPKAKSKDNPELSKGDGFAIASDIIDSSKKDIGDVDANCVVTKTTGRFEQSSAQCAGTLTLPDGTLAINVGGPVFAAKTTVGAVTGGTRDYEGASGTYSSVDSGRDTSTTTVKLQLPK